MNEVPSRMKDAQAVTGKFLGKSTPRTAQPSPFRNRRAWAWSAAALLWWWISLPVAAATYGQQVVAAVLLAEARSEGRRGMTAVAEVIRTRSEHYQRSPLAVVKMPRQFSCLNGTTPEELIRRFWRDPDWPVALSIARTLYNEPERLPGLVRGATHYHSARAYWARGHRPVAVIGKLRFYRLKLP